MARSKPNHRGIGQMLRAEFMVTAMRTRAEAGKRYAEAIAPVYEPGPHPGRYRDSFRVEAEVRRPPSSRRAVGYLINDAPEALWVEVGTGRKADGSYRTPRHRTLGRALDIMGGKDG